MTFGKKLALVLGLAFCTFGCGPALPPAQKVQIELQMQGQKYVPAAGQYLIVVLIPTDPGATQGTYPSNSMPNGSFEIVGMDGRGVPPGNYKVSVQSPMPGKDNPVPAELTTHQTPVLREVILGQAVLAPLDLANPTK